MTFRDLPPTLKAYILASAAMVLPVLWLVWQKLQPVNPLELVLLLLFAALFGTWKVELTVLTGKMTPMFAVFCLAQLLQGLPSAVLCVLFGVSLSSYLRPGKRGWRVELVKLPAHRWVFNISNGVVSAAVSSLVYEWVAKATGQPALQILALTAFTTSYFTINTLGTSLAIALQRSQGWFLIWRENFLWTAPGFFVSASTALAIHWSWNLLGAGSLLFLPWMYLVYYSYRLYIDPLNADHAHIVELNQLNQAIIASLATAIDAKDRNTASHISRVQHYAEALANAAGVNGKMLDAVRTGALVHDIGKLGIPDHILLKPGKLAGHEFRRMQSHVTIGAEILAPVQFPFPVVDVVMTHHERWDGLGYPNGLKGEEIPIGGRIISIVDVFDALTSNRPYRRAMTHQEASSVLREGAGKQFDPRLVDLFIQELPRVRPRIEALEAGERARAGKVIPDDEHGSALVQISQAATEMAAVCEVAQSLSEQETLSGVEEVIVSRALSHLPADTAVLHLEDPEARQLRAVKAVGKYAERLEGMTIDLGEGVSGLVAEKQQARVNAPAALDIARRFGPDENQELSAATAVPLLHGPEEIGVLTIYTAAYSVITPHHLHVLNFLAEHAASAIQNLRRFEQHRDLAFTDPLTGLANGRRLFRQLDWLRGDQSSNGHERVFSLVMVDLDGFKQVNDTLGHLRGDELLRMVSERLLELGRADDMVCRYAGDEFVLLLPQTDRPAAERVAARARAAVDNIGLIDGQVKIGASVGAATYPHDTRDIRELINQADTRMYQDKFERKRTTAR